MTRRVLSATLTAEELARRVRSRTGLRMEIQFTKVMLADWKARGVVEEHFGRWALTDRGRAMFSGFGLGLDDPTEAAA